MGILSHCCDSSLPWYSAGTVCVPMSAARLQPAPHLRFQIKESGEKFTCSAGDGGVPAGSGGKGYVSHWQRHFVMNLPCHITFLIFKSCSPVQAGESFSGRESLIRLLLASKLEQLWLCLSPNGK